jgi:uncharacterized membrane protein YdjX (TVP38/TMEM64 family)
LAGVVAAAAATVAFWSVLPVERLIATFVAFVNGLGVWGVAAFALAYIAVVLLFGPASVMSIAAGVAFGLWAIPFVLAVGTTSGVIAFLIARYLARDRVAAMLERHPRFQAIGRAIDAEGWKVVGLIRLSPPIPFAVTSYFFGVTNVGLWTFALMTLIGITPLTLVYVTLGALGHTLGTGAGDRSARWALLALGLIATAVAGTLVTRKARETLRAAGGTGEA